jgi:hypothetical protein
VQGHEKEQGEHAGRGAQGEGDRGGKDKTLADVQVLQTVKEAALTIRFQPFQFWQHGTPLFLLGTDWYR